MRQNDQPAVSAHTIRRVRVLGFCIYVLAFFLPAVREPVPAGAAVPPGEVYKGWFCAIVTLMNTFGHDVWRSKDCLAVLSGWINPLIVIYLVLLLTQNLAWARRVVAGLVAAFMIATWIYFAMAPLVPLVGHVLWIAGALMILAGEVVGWRSGAPAAAIENGSTAG